MKIGSVKEIKNNEFRVGLKKGTDNYEDWKCQRDQEQ